MELERAKRAAFAEEMRHMENKFQQLPHECKAALDKLEADALQLLRSIQTSGEELWIAISDITYGLYTHDELEAYEGLVELSRGESVQSRDS